MGNKCCGLTEVQAAGVTDAESTQEEIQKISDALYKFHEPMLANLDIVFFHGLECERAHVRDAHVLTWRSTAETGEKEEIWPQKWLPEDFPHARIISVRYDCYSKQTDKEGRMDLYLIGENLVQEIMWAREQCSDRPVILVGHGFGGILLKKLCVHAHEKRGMDMDMDMFLESIRGFFFYATPHLGMEGMEPSAENEGPLLRWMRVLNSESARLHEAFTGIWRQRRYRWTIYGLGEVESTLERHGLRVPEASARFGDKYMTVLGDHFSVCRPSDKKNNKYQFLHTLIEEVQRQVELERKPPMVVPEVTVGVDSLLAEILGKHIQDHRFVGLCGMGGVGKTTLAKLVFNKIYAKFEFSCFVEEIKQFPGTKDQVKIIVGEKMLRHGVPVCSASESYGAFVWHQVIGRSLFVVFDDVQDTDHVKLLKEIAHNGSGESRFIVTSRDMNRLRDCGHDLHIFPLDRLKDEDANKLFITYAFPGQQEPPKSLTRVVKRVVDGCEGLPLTLEVLGNYLRGKEIEHWKEIPRALRECDEIADLEEKVWTKLQLSYDRLPGNEVKYMFLDIASFFVFQEVSFSVEDAILAWTSIYGTGRNRLQTLEDRALVRIIVTGKHPEGYDIKRFYMHEHLRKMGQRIAKVRGRSFDLSLVRTLSMSNWGQGAEGEVHNRYPYDEEVIFQGDQELGKIVAHRVYISTNSMRVCGQTCAFCIMRGVWPNLTSIRYMDLVVDDARCCKECRSRGCPLPSTLVLLSVDYHGMRDFIISGGVGSNFPDDATGALVLTECTSLVKLKVTKCYNVDVGGLNKLQNLRILEIYGCRVVRNWPTSFRESTNLKRLKLLSIDKPFELPITFGNLTNLEYLSIEDCDVSSINPTSLQNLTSLRVLKVERIGEGQGIPNTIWFLRQLQILEVDCWFERFRESTALGDLFPTCQRIVELPDTLGNLTNLEELRLTCPIECLPASVSSLTRLKSLKLVGKFGEVHFKHGEGMVRLIENAVASPIYPSFHHLQEFMIKQKGLHLDCQQGTSAVIVRNMIGLELLEIKVSGPEAVPDIFGDLQKLRIFKLKCGAMENSLVESLVRLSSLEELHLVCRTVEQLPDVFGCFSTLKALRIACPSLQALPDTFRNFIQLTTLEVDTSKPRFWWSIAPRDLSPTCQGIVELPDTLGNLTNLEAIVLTWPIECIPASVSSLTRLKRLQLEGKFGKVSIADGEGVVRLMEDAVARPIYPSFHHLQGLMTKQKGLQLDCQDGTSAVIVRNMIGLESLEIKVSNHEAVPDIFGDLQKLRIFKLKCVAVENSLVESLERLSSLEELHLVCRTVEQLPDVFGCFSTLKALRIKCPSLQTLPETFGNFIQLTTIRISGNGLRGFWADLAGCTTLTTLPVGAWEIKRLPSQTMGQLPRLKELEISEYRFYLEESRRWDHLQHPLETICQMTHLESLLLFDLPIVTTLPEGLGNMHSLQKLQLLGCAFESLPENLGRLTRLTRLDIRNCHNLKTLPDTIGGLSSLKYLVLWHLYNLTTLPETVENLHSLERLELAGCAIKTLPESLGRMSGLTISGSTR